MSALLCTLGLLALSWTVHLAWWRIQLPRHPIAALLFTFGLTPLLVSALWVAGSLPPLVSAADISGMAALYLGATGCYLIAYAGVDQTSPSLVIVRALQAAGPMGRTRQELAELITEDNFVRPRLEALRRDRFVAEENGGFTLTPRGRRAARLAALVGRAFHIREVS